MIALMHAELTHPITDEFVDLNSFAIEYQDVG
jgi:hypothetical protein